MSSGVPWWPSRYGPQDELGSLNEITPAKILQAARLVREGVVYDLGRTLHEGIPRFPGRYWHQTLISSAYFINARRIGGTADGWGQNELNWITELTTGTYQIGTHLDALNHLQIGDRFYNGWRATEIVEEWGTNKLGVEKVPPVVTRGVLIDVAHHRGIAHLDAGEVIGVDEVEDALRLQHVTVEPGDVVLFHTGWGSLWETDPTQYATGEPGIGTAVAQWLVDHRIAITGADTWSFGAVPGEHQDIPFMVPQTLNVRHGVYIMENLATEVLAKVKVYEFMFVLTHAKTRGSTAAFVSPAAVR